MLMASLVGAGMAQYSAYRGCQVSGLDLGFVPELPMEWMLRRWARRQLKLASSGVVASWRG